MNAPYQLIKIIFGEFSYAFQSSISASEKLKGTRKNYLRSCSKTDPLNHVGKTFLQKHEIQTVNAASPIIFGNVKFGLSFREIRRLKGRFNYYDVEKYGDSIWRRLGFKERIFDQGVKRIYHFIDDEFFFGELFFDDIRKVEYKKIAGKLLEKYADKNPLNPEQDFRINHPEGFIYYINSGISLSIKYISTKSELINTKIDTIVENKLPNKKTQTSTVSETIL
jgi:hypothetical protein